MNLILVDSPNQSLHWAKQDPRAVHVRKVLRMGIGEKFYVGLVNGPRGMAEIVEDSESGMALSIEWEPTTPPAAPLKLLVGLPRPQTSRRVLFEAAVFGVQELHFFQSERGEPSYASSSLWSSDEWQRHLRQGAEQAFATTIPEVVHHASLTKALEAVAVPEGWASIALDVYEDTATLTKALGQSSGALLALGSERGWSPKERDTLREKGITLASLGERVLKTETACVAAMAIALARGN